MAETSARERHEWRLLGTDETPDALLPALREDYSLAAAGFGRRLRWRNSLPGQRGLPRMIAAGAFQATRDAVTLEMERGTPVLLVPVFLAAGAFIYFGLPREPGGFLIFAVAMAAGLAAFLVPRDRAWRPAIVALFLICLGALLAKVETWRVGTAMLGGEVSTRVTGRVAGLDRLTNGRARLTIDIVSTDRPKLRYAPRRIRATARKLPEGVRVGSMVGGLVRLRPPSGPVRPGSYDFSFESYFDGIGASGYFMGGVERLAPHAGGAADTLIAAIENVRDGIATRVRGRIGGAEGEIAAALMVGVRAGIPTEISESMRRSGLYHVISISGLHMALVAGVVIGALRAGMALFPGFASRRPGKKYAAGAGLAAIAAYMLISGGEVAAQRSFLMLAVMLIALLFDRAALTMRNLAISAVVVLAATPHEVVGPSFQMSFAATAALVAAYAWWTERSRAKAMPRQQRSFAAAVLRRGAALVAGLLVTSLVAGLATTAYGAYHFQRIAPLSLAANLVAMPIVSAVVMPSAVLAAVAMPFGLDGLFLDLMGKGISVMIAIADWFSRRSPIDAVGLISGSSVVLITIALIVATFSSTWLRLAGLPFALAGLLTIGDVSAPDVLISEDGALVGFLTPDNYLAVNIIRPDTFAAANWRRALKGTDIRKPEKQSARAIDSGRADASSVSPAPSAPVGERIVLALVESPGPDIGETDNQGVDRLLESDADEAALGKTKPASFRCNARACVGRHPSGAVIIHTSDAEEARRSCTFATLIVLDDAATPLKCADRTVAVVTRRELARSGSVAVYLPAKAGVSAAEIRYAIGRPDRPWHSHRIFSREARGLPPRRQRKP